MTPVAQLDGENVGNKILLFCRHFSNRRLTFRFESSLRRGGRYQPTELEGERYRPVISAAMKAAGASCVDNECGGQVAVAVINGG